MVLEQKLYELRVDKLKAKEIEKGIVDLLTDNQKQLYPPSTKSTEQIIDNPKENYRRHIWVNQYTATRRTTSSSYVTTPTASEDTTIEANTIKEISVKRRTASGEDD